MTDDQPLRGELYDELVRAMQKVPELAGRRADADRPVRRHHQPQLPGGCGGHDRSLGDPAGRQRHASPGDQPRGGACGDRRRGRRRRRARRSPRSSGPRATSSPGSSSARPCPMRPCGSPRRSDAWPIRSAASTMDRRSPGCSCRSGSARPTGRWRWPGACRIPPAYDEAAAIGRRIERAFLADPHRAPALPQRPAQRQLHRRRVADPDHRLGVRRDGRPVLRSRQLQHQPRAHRGRRTGSCCRPTTARCAPRGSRG